MEEELIFDQKIIDIMGEQIRERSSKRFSELENSDEQIAFQSLKNEAIRFMTDLNNLKINELNQSPLQQLMSEDAEAIYAEARERIKNDLRIFRVRRIIVRFVESINHFLNRKIILTIVDNDGKIYFHNEVNEKDLYMQSSPISGRGKFSLYIEKNNFNSRGILLDLEEKESNILNDYFDKIKRHTEEIKETFLCATERLKESTDHGEKKKDGFIYWHEPRNTRIYAYVNNGGVLAEAYVAALFAEKEEFGSPIQNSDGSFTSRLDPDNLKYYYKHFVKKVDNRAGIVSGDISNDILDKFQLAVKNMSASSQSFQNLTFIAQYIINSNELITKQDLKKWFLDQENGANKTYFPNNLMIKANKQVSDTLKTYLNDQNITFQYAL